MIFRKAVSNIRYDVRISFLCFFLLHHSHSYFFLIIFFFFVFWLNYYIILYYFYIPFHLRHSSVKRRELYTTNRCSLSMIDCSFRLFTTVGEEATTKSLAGTSSLTWTSSLIGTLVNFFGRTTTTTIPTPSKVETSLGSIKSTLILTITKGW